MVPDVAATRHLETPIVELPHVYRIETFARLIHEVRRIIGNIEVVTVAPAQRVDLIQIAAPLGANQRVVRVAISRR